MIEITTPPPDLRNREKLGDVVAAISQAGHRFSVDHGRVSEF
jgi:hypothetical protein